jgi:hypothetical protein
MNLEPNAENFEFLCIEVEIALTLILQKSLLKFPLSKGKCHI